MKTTRSIISLSPLLTATALMLGAIIPARAQLLGAAGSYGALAGSTVTNTGSTIITGDLGVSPGTAITGFATVDGGPGLFTGEVNQANAASTQAQADLTAAYLALEAMSFDSDLSGQDLGGLTLVPGVYFYSSSAQLTGTLTLDAQGDSNARFVFLVGSTLTTASNSRVSLINVSPECGPDNGLFWQIGSSATLGTGSAFAGSILALTSITLNTGATIDYGRALAINGGVTLDTNLIDASNPDGGFCAAGLPGGITPVPEASTYGLLGSMVLLLGIGCRRARDQRNRTQA